MIEGFLSLFYILISLLYLKYFRSSTFILRYYPTLLCFAGILISILLVFSFDNALLPGAPDQNAYVRYGEYCQNGAFGLSRAPGLNPGLFTAYPWVNCFVFHFAGFPFVSIKLVNLLSFTLVVLFAHRTAYNLSGDKKVADIVALLTATSPSLLLFNFYQLKDSFIVGIFSASVLLISEIYRMHSVTFGKFMIYGLLLALMSVLQFFFRSQMVFVTAILGVSILSQRIIQQEWILAIFTFCLPILVVKLGVAFGINHVGILDQAFMHLITDFGVAWRFLSELIFELLRWSFILPDQTLNLSVNELIFGRLLTPDSFLLPLIFWLTFALLSWRNKIRIATIMLPAFVSYSALYFYFREITPQAYGLGFRQTLPFFYLYILFLPIMLTSTSVRILSAENKTQ